jgi:hypothetical protein
LASTCSKLDAVEPDAELMGKIAMRGPGALSPWEDQRKNDAVVEIACASAT